MATAKDREVLEGKMYQGVDEIISYTINVARVGDSPTSPSVVVWDTITDSDVTDLTMPLNNPTVNGSVITLSPLGQLVSGITYRVEVLYHLNGNVLENYFIVLAQD